MQAGAVPLAPLCSSGLPPAAARSLPSLPPKGQKRRSDGGGGGREARKDLQKSAAGLLTGKGVRVSPCPSCDLT